MALPLSAALGPYLLPISLGAVTLFAYRALIIALFCLSILSFSRFDWWDIPPARTYALLGAVWILWAGAGAFWAPDLNRAVLEMAALAFGFVTGVTLLQLRAYALDAMHALRRGWILAFIATSAVSAWELVTGQHLPPPGGGERLEPIRVLATSTFGNPNNYAAFLLLAVPFLVWSHVSTRHRLRRIFYLACLLALPFLLFLTSSRVSLLGLIAEAGALWLLGSRYRFGLVAYSVAVLGMGVAAVQALGLDLRMIQEMASLVEGDGVGGSGSIAKRWGLLLAGLWLLLSSGGFGVGPGGFEPLVRRGAVPFDTGGLVNPHNFWIEVLSQYGLPIFAAFVAWLGYLTYVVLQKRRQAAVDPSELETRTISDILLTGLTGYLFAAFANSSYMTQSTNWMFWASIVVMAAYLWRKRLVGVLPVQRVDSGAGSGAAASPDPRTTDGDR